MGRAVSLGGNFVIRGGRIRLLLALIGISLGLWIVFAKLVVPAVITSAYRGESWSFLNRLITGQATVPLSDYLQDWNRVTIAGLLSGLGFWIVVLVISSPAVIQRVPAVYKGVALLTLNALILLLCFEVASLGAVKIWSVVPKAQQLVGEGSPRETVSYYAGQDWAAQFWHEFRLTRKQRYYPYVGWRRAPFNGTTINIDQRGIRLTPGADCRPNSYKVFAFGGSTMWGTGSPNWGTIAAYLQAGLEKLRHGPVCVVNFGETAYVSTQGVILLLMQLQSGNVPNLVLFFDGASDIYAAYQSGRAGTPQNLAQLAARFETSSSPTFLERLRSSYSYSLIENLVVKPIIAKPRQQNEPPAPELGAYEITHTIDVPTLSDSIVQDYFGNYKIVTALAQRYGFNYFFFLQPIVSLGGKSLTSEEEEMRQRLEMGHAINKLLTSVYQRAELESSKHYRNFYSMTHVFDGYNPLVWIDEFHVTPVGNQLLAQKMLEVVVVDGYDGREVIRRNR